MFCFHTYNIYMSLLIHSIMKKFQYFIEREKRTELLGFLLSNQVKINLIITVKCQHSMEIRINIFFLSK